MHWTSFSSSSFLFLCIYFAFSPLSGSLLSCNFLQAFRNETFYIQYVASWSFFYFLRLTTENQLCDISDGVTIKEGCLQVHLSQYIWFKFGRMCMIVSSKSCWLPCLKGKVKRLMTGTSCLVGPKILFAKVESDECVWAESDPEHNDLAKSTVIPLYLSSFSRRSTNLKNVHEKNINLPQEHRPNSYLMRVWLIYEIMCIDPTQRNWSVTAGQVQHMHNKLKQSWYIYSEWCMKKKIYSKY